MVYAPRAGITEAETASANRDLDAKDRANRQDAAVALRIAGATYSDIARTLDYASATSARQAVERSLAESVGAEGREQMRFIEGRRLERLLRATWGKATNDSDPEHLAAVRTAVTIIDRHSRLYGLDAPTEMVVYSPSTGEIEEWVTKMSRQVHGELPQEADIIDADEIE